MLVLASYRLTHLLVFDSIAEPLRRWVAAVPGRGAGTPGPAGRAPHGHPSGPRPVGPVRAFFSTLLGCHWCAGVWTSAGLVLLCLAWPSPVVKALLLVLAVAGGQALLESATQSQR